ncbi:hypothetical protein WAI453_010965 [Rhynchosporium graminicola]
MRLFLKASQLRRIVCCRENEFLRVAVVYQRARYVCELLFCSQIYTLTGPTMRLPLLDGSFFQKFHLLELSTRSFQSPAHERTGLKSGLAYFHSTNTRRGSSNSST